MAYTTTNRSDDIGDSDTNNDIYDDNNADKQGLGLATRNTPQRTKSASLRLRRDRALLPPLQPQLGRTQAHGEHRALQRAERGKSSHDRRR